MKAKYFAVIMFAAASVFSTSVYVWSNSKEAGTATLFEALSSPALNIGPHRTTAAAERAQAEEAQAAMPVDSSFPELASDLVGMSFIGGRTQ
jgi:hypothetical protein